MEQNYHITLIYISGIDFNFKRFKHFKDNIFNNYSDEKLQFLKTLNNDLSSKKQDLFQTLSFQYFLEIYQKKPPVETKPTPISSANESSNGLNQSGSRGGSHPHSSEDESSGVEGGSSNEWVRRPLSEVIEYTEGEKRRYKIWISDRNIDHFKSLYGNFRPERTGTIDSEIWDKIKDELDVEYSSSNNWATPITKEKQQELGICFTMQMTLKGYMKFHLKKGIGVKTFFYHFMRIFDFLSYEEKAHVLEELFLSNIKEKAFQKVHLANRVGPKPTIDDDFKGAKLEIIYATLSNGKTQIEITIDYSDPQSPEIEFKGPEGPTSRLRDVVKNGVELAPTWDNIAEWSRETRNTSIKNKMQLNRNHRAIKNTGELLYKTQRNTNRQLQTQSNQLTTVLQEQEQIQDKQQSYFNALDAKLTQHGDIIQTIPEYQERNMEINNIIAQAIMGVSEMTVNQGQIFDQALGQTKEEIIEVQKEDTDLLLNEVQDQNKKLDTIQETISQMSDRIDVLRDVFETQFEKARRQYKDNLLRVLDLVAKMPGKTSKEIIKSLKEELDVSQTTMYKYFRKLQEKGLIDAYEVKNGKRGRPPRAFSITDKLKNLIKKITKN